MSTTPHNFKSDAAVFYSAAALAEAPRLLSLLDREPQSPTYGSFDREHWAWKFRDFPLGMQQTAVYPLALLWRHPFSDSPYHQNERLLQWIFGAIEQTLARQHANGAFDAFAPNEQDPGPTLGVLHGLLEAWRLAGEHAPAPLAQRFHVAARKACDFAMRREETETHAFVSNHWALFAVAFFDVAELLGDQHYRRRAEAVIARILREQSPDGWYNEYGGPDPGYESLSLFHLAVYWQRTGSREVLESLRRCIGFYAHCVHPDGGVGGVYGHRHTSLYFPGGFEILAPQLPMAASLARYMRERWHRSNVLTPGVSDAENLPSMCYTYLEAALAAREPSTTEPLPYERLEGERHFPDSGLLVVGNLNYYAMAHTKRGGLLRVFEKPAGKLAYEDAGYLVRAGGRLWTSQMAGLGAAARSGKTATCRTQFCEVRPLVPTPGRFMVLRLLNLTLFRSLLLGEWLRKLIVKRLILTRHTGPLALCRTLAFHAEEIEFRDQLTLVQPMPVEEVALPREFTAIHMGSAKYFHPSQLDPLPSPPVEGIARALNRGRAENEFKLVFAPGKKPEIVGCAGAPPITAPIEELAKA